jgi:PAS domain S-box-containing protein
MKDGRAIREFVGDKLANPEAFQEKVNFLNSHPIQKSIDEISLKNGQTFECYSAPLVDSTDRYRGRIWYFRDVTERKQTEDWLRLLSSVVEQSPVSVVIADLQGNITYVNRKFSETSGYGFEEVLGKNSRILKSGHTTPEDYRELWTAIRSGKEWRGIFHNRKKNGDMYWESAVIRPLQDHDGITVRFVALKEDITEKLALESQLRQSQKLEAIGQLAAGIAHEINTPIQYVGDNTRFFKESWSQLSSLLSAAQALRDEVTPEMVSKSTLETFDRCNREADVEYLAQDFPRAIDQTLEGVERVSQIVRAMKEFSHPGSQEKRAIDLNKAIETTMIISHNEWKYVAKMETRLDPDLPLVPCLAGEINQVLLNLVVNSAPAIAEAVKGDRSGMGTITVATRRGGDWVEFSVSDTGIGIPDHIKERVFDPFFTTKAIGKGTGQGLMLAHTVIVKKHNGKIWFDSEPGKGTTFYVRLPLSPVTEE